MRQLAVDLHVHLGSSRGNPVKIGASRSLTLDAVIEVGPRTGMDAIGVVDCQVRGPWSEIGDLLRAGCLSEEPGGGLHRGKTLIIPAAEVQCGGAHFLCYLPDRESLAWMASRYCEAASNPALSTGALAVTPSRLRAEVEAAGGVFVPAHIFIPYTGFYGRDMTVSETLQGHAPDVAEMGLSANATLAGGVAHLQDTALVASSDAHSLPMIGREHTLVMAPGRDFRSIMDAVLGRRGRIVAYRGLDPRLGKYYLSGCPLCGWLGSVDRARGQLCDSCGARAVLGVKDRAASLRATSGGVMRPPYLYGTPLEWLPGVGAVTRDRLVGGLGPAWDVLHHVSLDRIADLSSDRVAGTIADYREGRFLVKPGGGGRYGKLVLAPPGGDPVARGSRRT